MRRQMTTRVDSRSPDKGCGLVAIIHTGGRFLAIQVANNLILSYKAYFSFRLRCSAARFFAVAVSAAFLLMSFRRPQEFFALRQCCLNLFAAAGLIRIYHSRRICAPFMTSKKVECYAGLSAAKTASRWPSAAPITAHGGHLMYQ